MKKIGILTITDYLNYGNRLQNYATQEILKARGFDVVSIANVTISPKEEGFKFLMFRIKNALGKSPATLLRSFQEKLRERQNKEKYVAGQRNKEKSFREFSAKHIAETGYVISPENLPKNLSEEFDYFVVGSDQIWNPNIRYGSSVDFLTFAPVEKRIAFAPSFGVSHIPEKFTDDYRCWLNKMKCISVREDAGADIVKELTGKDVPVLIDPTLMLSEEKWLQVSEKARKKPEKPYIVTYFIGTMSGARKKLIHKLASDNNLDLAMLANLDDIDRYDANPGEFIDYIHFAELVCTDSFHAIIFAIQMKRPFIVFDREGKSVPMSSRIDTLLRKFHFEDRKYSEKKISRDYFEINFEHVDNILKGEIEKVNNYLDAAFN
ncbi:MAG: polysaccharide pyruvyl transferase family protein [Paludibacter sp.]|nr:polysaccharide pyruvyl transferase family protein [Paludibacter sp.]